MNSIQSFKMPYAPKTPPRIHDDSGYGSMIGKGQDDSACEHGAESISMCLLCSSREILAFRRPRIVSVETIKKKLFPGSPYSPQDRSSDSSKSSESTLLQRMVAMKFTQDLKLLSSDRTKPAYRLPPKCPNSPPVKFFYSPLKNSGLFRGPESSPRESAVPFTKTDITPNFERWGASLSLPELHHDLLKKIVDKNLTFVLSSILSHLSDKDLYRVGCVSSIWKQIVLGDSEARKRRENYVAKRFSGKENKMIATDISLFRTIVNGVDRELLLDVTNQELFKKPLPSKIPTPKSEHFLAVAKEIGNTGVLLKCPVCRYPAKCMMGNKYCCTRDLCYYVFCRKCLGLHASLDCPARCHFEPKVIIGSKQSKRNLRRL